MRVGSIVEDARRYLRRIRELDNLITTMQDEIDVTWAKLTSVTVKQKEVNVMTSSTDTMPETIEKLIQYKEKINAQIDIYVDLKVNAKNIIDQMDVVNYKMILIKYYFQNKTFEQIAEDLDLSYQWIFELHGRALDDFERIWKKL